MEAVAVVPVPAVTHLYQVHLADQKWLLADLHVEPKQLPVILAAVQQVADLHVELKQLPVILAAMLQVADLRVVLRRHHAILAAVQLDVDQHAEPKWLPVILVQVLLDQAVDAKLLRKNVLRSHSWVFLRESRLR